MYIEKLSTKDIEEIFIELISIVEGGNTETPKKFLKDKQIVHTPNTVSIYFDSAKSFCMLSDFNATVSYAYTGESKDVQLAYRKYMYKKFGNEYYNDMRDSYKRKIMKECDKKLEKLSNELNEMIK